MHSKTLITNSNPTTINDHINDNNHSNSNSNSDSDSISPPESNTHVDDSDHELIVCDNNPPESSWISHNNVTDWLNHNHTFIERKTSVKMVASSRKFDSCSSSSVQTRTSQRSVSFNHKPQATIIGFRQKQPDGKSKQINDRLFKNRSLPLPGKTGSGVHVAEPRSPRVSCMGRVGSMRGRARRNGFWRKVKAAILTRVRTNKRASG